jgi:uncharacterized SAM-binding protein YcdF (DUF218 family)
MPEIVPMSDTVGAVDLDSPDLTDLLPESDPVTPAAISSIETDPTRVDATEVDATGADTTEILAVGAVPVDPAAVDPRSTDPGTADPPASVRRGRRRRWPYVLLAIVLVLGAAGLYYAVSFWQVRSTGRSDQAQPVDAIVVMGAAQYDGRPSPQLAARLDHVVDLWGEGLAPIVVTTGGNLPGDRFTEAEASANYLIERGVPTAAILAEDLGSTSYESLEGVAEMMDVRGLGSVLIVTDPYHALRSRLIAEEVGMTAYVSPTPYSVVGGRSNLRRHLGEAAGVALGRIIGFERLSGLTS